MMFRLWLYVAGLLALWGCGGVDSAGSGREYFVSLSGGDNGDGTASHPFGTIQKALETARAGDTVTIRPGTYRERLVFGHSGTDAHPIWVRSEEEGTVVIDGTQTGGNVRWGGLVDLSDVSYIHLSGLRVQNTSHAGIFLDHSHHITIEKSQTDNTYSSGIGVWDSHNITINDNEVSLACNGGGEECISIANSHHVTVERNEVHHNGPGAIGGEGIDVKQGSHDVRIVHNDVHHLHQRTGLYADAWDAHTYNIIFDGNRVHHCSNFGMAVASEMGGVIEQVVFMNNIVYHNTDGGMVVGGWTAEGQSVPANPVRHITILNNTIYDNAQSDGLYIANPDARDIKVYNNIIGRNEGKQIHIENTPLEAIDLDANLIEGEASEYGKHPIKASPEFVDADKGDFRLRPGSPARDHGRSTDVCLYDIVGRKRPQNGAWDIGAYESP